MHVDDIVAVSNSCMFLKCIGVMFRHTIAHFFALFPGSGSVSFSKFTCQKSVSERYFGIRRLSWCDFDVERLALVHEFGLVWLGG